MIFSRKYVTKFDDDPYAERPRVDLAGLDKALAPTPQRFAPRPPEGVEELRSHLEAVTASFAAAVASAHKYANDWLETYTALQSALEAEKAKLTSDLAKLDKIEASMPKFGGTDAQTPASTDRPHILRSVGGSEAMLDETDGGDKSLPPS